MSSRRRTRIPNSWETPAPLVATPTRLKRAVHSRQKRMGEVSRPTGMPRYYDSLKTFKRVVKRRARDDLAGLIAALRAHGSVYIRDGGDWDRLTAAQVIEDFGLEQDSSHHHLKRSPIGSVAAEGDGSRSPQKAEADSAVGQQGGDGCSR